MTTPNGQLPARPENVPEQFWDATAGAIKTDALLKAFADTKAAHTVATQQAAELRAKIGLPAVPDKYDVTIPAGLTVNDVFYNDAKALGLSNDQMKSMMTLMEKHFIPVVQDVVSQYEKSILAQSWNIPKEQVESRITEIRAKAEQLWGKDRVAAFGSDSEGIRLMERLVSTTPAPGNTQPSGEPPAGSGSPIIATKEHYVKRLNAGASREELSKIAQAMEAAGVTP